MTTDNRPLRDRAQPAATWVGTDRRSAVPPIVPVLTPSTEPATPPPSGGEPVRLTRNQQIRADALHEAVGIGFQFDGGHDDPVAAVLDVAARFEAYIRDGAA